MVWRRVVREDFSEEVTLKLRSWRTGTSKGGVRQREEEPDHSEGALSPFGDGQLKVFVPLQLCAARTELGDQRLSRSTGD